MIDEVGVDRITTVGVAKRAGLTTGAMYARYEHQDELLADVWQRVGVDAVKALVDAAVRASRTHGADAGDLVRLLEEHPAELRVAVELLAVSRRVDELADVARMDVIAMLDEYGLTSATLRHDVSAVMDLGMVTLALGCVLGSHVVASSSIAVADAVPRLSAAPRVADDGSQPSWSGPAPSMPPQVAPDDDPVLTALVQASQTVIARVGVHRATLSSIGRVARVVPTLVYSRYENRDELMSDVLRRVQTTVVSARTQAALYHGVSMMSTTMVLWSSPEMTITRRFRREVLIATRREPQWQAIAASVEGEAQLAAAELLGARHGSYRGALAMQCVGSLGSEGTSLLQELGVDMTGVDWTPLAERLVGFARSWQD